MNWREELQAQHQQRIANRLWRHRPLLESPQGREITVGGKRYLNFCSNDYLGLSRHPQVVAAAERALRRYGTGSGASHLVCGHLQLHQQLEERIAAWVGAESAVVFSTGYMANLAVPQTFLQAGDLLLQDRLNHASLIDAGLACGATLKRFAHADVAAAEAKLLRFKKTTSADGPRVNRRTMITTDGIFSMDGDAAPVASLAALARQHDALLLVDDAHGLGVLGPRGAGLLEQVGVAPTENVLLLGTLGKAVGSFGAFVAGDRIWIESLIQHARTYIYTTALPPAVVAATLAAIEVIVEDRPRRLRLSENIDFFRRAISDSCITGEPNPDGEAEATAVTCGDHALQENLPPQENLRENRYQLLPSLTPIQPLVVGTAEDALSMSQRLREQGFWVTAIRPPTVPAGSSRLRITLTSEHGRDDIESLVTALKRAAASGLGGKLGGSCEGETSASLKSTSDRRPR